IQVEREACQRRLLRVPSVGGSSAARVLRPGRRGAPHACVGPARSVRWPFSCPDMAEITKSYEPREVEQKWYAAWTQAKAFAGRVDPSRESYSIVIPPPNVTGVLTM